MVINIIAKSADFMKAPVFYDPLLKAIYIRNFNSIKLFKIETDNILILNLVKGFYL